MKLEMEQGWLDRDVVCLLVDGEEVVASIHATDRGLLISSPYVTACPTLKVGDRKAPPAVLINLKP